MSVPVGTRAPLRPRLGAVALLLLAACAERGAHPSPELRAVSPQATFDTEATVLEVSGEHFYAHGTLALMEGARVEDTLALWLGEVPLSAVKRLDSAHLTGVLPSGVAEGTYPLRLVDAWGREAVLERAVTVRQRRGARLALVGSAPAATQEGNTAVVTVDLTNEGDTAVNAARVEAQVPSGTGAASLFQQTNAQDLAPGETRSYRLLYRTVRVGEVRFSLSASGTDAFFGADAGAGPLELGPMVIFSPPVLVATVSVQPSLVALGETLQVATQVTNAGTVEVQGFLPTAQAQGSATFLGLTVPLPQAIGPGATRRFVHEFQPTQPGAARFDVDGQGTIEATSLPAFLSAVTTLEVQVLTPPELSAAATAAPQALELGEIITVDVVVNNAGQEAVDQVSVSLTPLGTGACAPLSNPAPQWINAGGAASFRVVFEATRSGTIRFEVNAAGLSDRGRQPAVMPAVFSGQILVMGPPDAGAEDAGVPDAGAPDAGAPDAGAPDAGVPDAGTPDAGMPDAGAADAGPTDAGPPDAGAPPDGGPSDAGTPAAADAGVDGGPLTDGGVVTRIAIDPFSDGQTSVTHVAFLNGFVHVGPNEVGTSIARFTTGGQLAQVLPISVPKDTSGSRTMSNTLPGPFTRLGSSGCQPNSTCGPDNENHRVFMFSGDLSGSGVLAFGPSRTGGNLAYAYTGSPLLTTAPLSYADLGACIPAGSTAQTAGVSMGGRLYFGYSNNGAGRPGLVKLATRPADPGLNAVPLVDCWNLKAGLMPGLAGASPNRVDALGVFNDRLYLANANAWYRSTSADPLPFDTNPGDWIQVTPTAPEYAARPSRTSVKDVGFAPSDFAVPHFAAFKGRFFAARNTTSGPQVWSCEPALTASPLDCDGGDWRLIAPNSTGDGLLSSFNSAGLTSVTLLEATANYLYVGFNSNSLGLHVFRTANPAASTRADFAGADGCDASQYPGSCMPLGQRGFEDTENSVIFSATAFRSFTGSLGLILAVGKASAPVRIFRIDD